ncbi:MAG: DNA starvation/stationary phase protection protein [Gammaproteobacteria bacterium]|nr:DNA starvation/stationary phase protection protein [Gammaproteobacteria bacterium]
MDTSYDVSNKDKTTIANGLRMLLSDNYRLYLKMQNYHHHRVSPWFDILQLIEEQNTDLANIVDDITNRLQVLGKFVPDADQAHQKLSAIGETTSVPTQAEIIRQLIVDQEVVIRTTQTLLTHAEIANDAITAVMLTLSLRTHKKHVRALRHLL